MLFIFYSTTPASLFLVFRVVVVICFCVLLFFILPFYHQEDNHKTFSANFPDSWESYQLIDATEATTANKRALLALKNDISGLCFSNPNNLDVLLKDIKIEHIRIDFTKYHKSFPETWKKYTTGKKIQGAFHAKEKIKLQN